MMHIVCAYPWVLPWVAAVTLSTALYVWRFKKKIRYRYALAHVIKASQAGTPVPARHVLFLLRLCGLAVLAFLIARPQWLDTRRTVNVQGIDIMLALDASGSMELFDDLKDRTPRIEAAKREALDFIAKRTNDPIGVVLFAAHALSKLPLTLDKQLLATTIRELNLGDIDPDGTLLYTGVATAINRLRHSTARSKIIVLLTDGVPSENDPVDADMVVQLAREFGIKIYTLGIGRAEEAYRYDPFGRVVAAPSSIDVALLKRLAEQTGGCFYRAYTPADLKKAYAAIDALERTEINATLFQHYQEAFGVFILCALLALIMELVLRLFVWKGLL